MTVRTRIAMAAAVLVLGGGVAVLPATSASAAYACNWTKDSRGDWYAGYYSGNTVQPSTTGVSAAGIEAQCLLKHLHYTPTIDGVFGPSSQADAKAFQKMENELYHAGLKEDGKIGPKSWPWLRDQNMR
jgi:peptidoglycan hydrolase-like protein with peptidoglycan-binding domain